MDKLGTDPLSLVLESLSSSQWSIIIVKSGLAIVERLSASRRVR